MNDKNVTREQELSFFREMQRIRLFEEQTLAEFSKGRLFGTTHTYIGQEANAVGILSAAERSDIVFSNHRGHGHYLAHGGDLRKLAAELMGKDTGICGGWGGSQHLYFESFYSNGILGGTIPCATGVALAEKYKKTGKITIAFLGDGTLGEGVLYESLNMASLWKIPILYVIENNRYAQTTPIELALSGSIRKRFEAFQIETEEIETTDVCSIYSLSKPILQSIRASSAPRAFLIHTYRFSAHSKGDDTRDPAEIARYREKDPLLIHGQRLTQLERDTIAAECQKEVQSAFEQSREDAWPDPKILNERIWR
jgi:TPP-dependent pyruvate/acetoin dehydrogenase alpha subunit